LSKDRYHHHQGTNNDNKIEASRLYLCSEKIFKLASILENQKKNSHRKELRKLGSTYANILMIDYITPRIVLTRNENNDRLQIEWSILATDLNNDVLYDGFKILSQLPHIEHIRDEIRDEPFRNLGSGKDLQQVIANDNDDVDNNNDDDVDLNRKKIYLHIPIYISVHIIIWTYIYVFIYMYRDYGSSK
jgi:hypothetical protein